MLRDFLTKKSSKSSIGLVIVALLVGGISAQASGVLNSPSGGYLVCVDSKTKLITHPGTSSCRKGAKQLIIGATGQVGATGLTGAAGINGIDGKDGNTLWNGINDPEVSLGKPGDMFINATTKTLFGPKDLISGWPVGVSMVGPKGDRGPDGSTGSTGPQGPSGVNGSNATLTCAQGGTCAIGNTGPGGGVVFYLQTPTAAAPWRYLEAAPNTWSGGTADPQIGWCSETSNYIKSLADGTNSSMKSLIEVGSGYRNTKMMLEACSYGAANMAASYNGGGKGDWFLPSKDELYQLYLQKTIVGGFVANFYWSSSEAISEDAAENGQLAWRMYSSIGIGSMNFKFTPNGVRPIRAF